MPQILDLALAENKKLGIWKIEEDPDFFESQIDFTKFDLEEFSKFTHPTKQLQWLASRYFLKKLIGENYQLKLKKTSNGKPYFLNNSTFFSISHSMDSVAIILGNRNNAIDIESKNPKLIRISKKFVNERDFKWKDLSSLTKIWCAKETVYKWLDIEGLSLREHIAIKEIKENTIVADVFFQEIVRVLYIKTVEINDKIVCYID